MKLNTSVNINKFKEEVEELRKELNKCLITGKKNDDFEHKLDKLVEQEEDLLRIMIPYYRSFIDSAKNTSITTAKVKTIGAFSFEGFAESILKISDNLYIVSSTDGGVQFLSTMDRITSLEVEWSRKIEGITERITFMHSLEENKIMLFGVRGNCYLITIDDKDSLPDMSHIYIEKLMPDFMSRGFGRGIVLSQNMIVIENDDNRISLMRIKESNNKYHLILSENTDIKIDMWTVCSKITDNIFAVGTANGEVYFIEYAGNKFNIKSKIDALNSTVRAVETLENETGTGTGTSVMVSGNNGNCKIYNLSQKLEINNENSFELKGNIFKIASFYGTAVVLSEDGIVYLFEENFGHWTLNENTTIEDIFITNLCVFDESRYLLVDLDSQINELKIDRIQTPDDLWNLPIYV